MRSLYCAFALSH